MASLNLTAREQELLCAVIDTMKADIDWKEVAPKANFNTAKQARDKWATVRTKIAAGLNGDDTTSPKKKATPAGKKRKAADEETPAKKKSKKAETPAAEEEDDAAEEGQGFIKSDPDSGDELL